MAIQKKNYVIGIYCCDVNQTPSDHIKGFRSLGITGNVLV